MHTQMLKIYTATKKHINFAGEISELINLAAQTKDIGLALRTPAYIQEKILEGKAIIALADENKVAGFCYLETWGHGKYVANSGLIVSPEYRKLGLAKQIKMAAYELSRKKYPDAKLFGLTTSPAVLKINSMIGYRPVAFAELTQDDEFWNGCKTCPNYDILVRTSRKFCLCTAMLLDPDEKEQKMSSVDHLVNAGNKNKTTENTEKEPF
jgi:GNAT superfamily N-acetyltransferase